MTDTLGLDQGLAKLSDLAPRGYALDRRYDLRSIIYLREFVRPWPVLLHVPLDILHQIA